MPLVLVVEDFEDLYELYSDFLASAGYAVQGTNNGAEAIIEAQRTQPDLILMDLALPRMSGWEAIERIKSDPDTRHIPIIALTGHVRRRYSDLARHAGADLVLWKPCPLNQLAAEIERLLERTTLTHAPAESGGELDPI